MASRYGNERSRIRFKDTTDDKINPVIDEIIASVVHFVLRVETRHF